MGLGFMRLAFWFTLYFWCSYGFSVNRKSIQDGQISWPTIKAYVIGISVPCYCKLCLVAANQRRHSSHLDSDLNVPYSCQLLSILQQTATQRNQTIAQLEGSSSQHVMGSSFSSWRWLCSCLWHRGNSQTLLVLLYTLLFSFNSNLAFPVCLVISSKRSIYNPC